MKIPIWIIFIVTGLSLGMKLKEAQYLGQWEKDWRQSLKQFTPQQTITTQTMKVTAYCSCSRCCGKYANGITASGYKIRKESKFCASPLPFCTILDIPGYGIVPVLDRGGAIKENCIDVFFNSHSDALVWGVQYLEVKKLR